MRPIIKGNRILAHRGPSPTHGVGWPPMVDSQPGTTSHHGHGPAGIIVAAPHVPRYSRTATGSPRKAEKVTGHREKTRNHAGLYLTPYQACANMLRMKSKRRKLSDQIRRAVDTSGLSRYRICKETGIDEGGFSRFMAGKVGMTQANLDAVADVLGLEVVAVDPRPVAPPKRPGRKRKAGGK